MIKYCYCSVMLSNANLSPVLVLFGCFKSEKSPCLEFFLDARGLTSNIYMVFTVLFL